MRLRFERRNRGAGGWREQEIKITKLIDTSSWIEQPRSGGDRVVRERVESLLLSGEAAWCPVVRLELPNGAREGAAGARGVTVPVTDLVVAACAGHHRVPIEHADAHFDLIASLPAE